MNTNNYAIVMAGGIGSRFWPVSTPQKPKQFQDMMGSGSTLIQKTMKRLQAFIPLENIYILTSSAYKDLVLEQLPQLSPKNVLHEPVMRNTAPCILYASLKINSLNPLANILVASSDHWINAEDLFASDVLQCFEHCKTHSDILTLGIKPHFPSTGYGYIEYDKADAKYFKDVTRFVEKPTKNVAELFLEKQNYLWNAGIFIWNVKTILKAFEQYKPEMYKLLLSEDYNTDKEEAFINQTYPNAENISVDYAILELAANIKVLLASFDWNDLGTWGALYDTLPKDGNANVAVAAKSHFVDANANIVTSTTEKQIVVCGLNDFIVVDTPEALLICPRSREQEVKSLYKLAN